MRNVATFYTNLIIGFEFVHNLCEREAARDLGVLAEVREEYQVVPAVLHGGHYQVPAAVAHLRRATTTTLHSDIGFYGTLKR